MGLHGLLQGNLTFYLYCFVGFERNIYVGVLEEFCYVSDLITDVGVCTLLFTTVRSWVFLLKPCELAIFFWGGGAVRFLSLY
jgi:hypothetical protein